MAMFWIIAFLLLSQEIYLMKLIIIALIIGRILHGFIIVSEHEGLSSQGHMLQRTRSVYSTKLFRWFWWNMNFHAEHHAWPSVPFHQLKVVNELLLDHDFNNERSYFSFFLKRSYRK
jgi:fatty acid desaturase